MSSRLAARDVVEKALAAVRCDEAIVLAEETSSANLRWAGNTLTTNGVARSRQLTVIAVTHGRAGAAAGVVSRAGVRDDQIAAVVAEAEQAAAQGSPAEDAVPLVPGAGGAGAGWDDPVTGTEIGVFGSFAPALGAAFAEAAAADRKLYGYAEHLVTTTFLGSSSGLRLRFDQPEGKVELNAKSADLSRSAWAGASAPDFAGVDVAGLDRGPGPAAGLGAAAGRAAGRALRDPAAALGGRRPDGLPVLVGRGQGRAGRPHGVQQARRRDPDR